MNHDPRQPYEPERSEPFFKAMKTWMRERAGWSEYPRLILSTFLGLIAVAAVAVAVIGFERRSALPSSGSHFAVSPGSGLTVMPAGGGAKSAHLQLSASLDAAAQDNVQKAKVVAKISQWTIEAEYDHLRGKVINNSGRPVLHWKVACQYVDANNKVLDSDFAESNEVLPAGASKDFEILHLYLPDNKKVLTRLEDVTLGATGGSPGRRLTDASR